MQNKQKSFPSLGHVSAVISMSKVLVDLVNKHL